MGLFDVFKKQFIDVIDWVENDTGTLMFRYPMMDREIQNGAQLTVRETQAAVFVNEGKIADTFGPGLHKLTTQTLPILTTLKNWDKLFQSPFKSDVYFFSTREQIDQRWGTQAPITIRDKEFGAVRLRAHGSYSYRVSNPNQFFKKIAGTSEIYTTTELDGQLRGAIVSRLGTFLGGSEIAFLDMAANQSNFSNLLSQAVKPIFQDYGLELRTFYVQSISLPEELQTHLDRASSMKMVGDLRSYTQFQAADSLTKGGGAGDGGIASAGAALGVGAAIGQSMMQNLGTASQGAAAEDPIQTIEKLHGLVKSGVLTQQEFDVKKAELLKRIK